MEREFGLKEVEKRVVDNVSGETAVAFEVNVADVCRVNFDSGVSFCNGLVYGLNGRLPKVKATRQAIHVQQRRYEWPGHGSH